MAAPICKRWELLVVGLFGSLALWGYVVAGMVKIPLPLDAAGLAAVDDVVFALPGWCLMTLGSYALWTIGYALLVFKDVPEAGEELKVQEAEARAFYKGFKGLGFAVGEIPDEGEGKVGMN